MILEFEVFILPFALIHSNLELKYPTLACLNIHFQDVK